MFYSTDGEYPTPRYPHTKAMLGYLGGDQAAHTWSDEDWAEIPADMLAMGIWVADFNKSPVDQATDAVTRARSLRFAANARSLRGILGDFETVTEPVWIAAWGVRIRTLGFMPLGYESESVYHANPKLDGVVVADFDNIPTIPNLPEVVAHQFKANVPWGGHAVDLTVWDDGMAQHFGHDKRP
jgi:hypothetical protein